jgi:hypothetical protein
MRSTRQFLRLILRFEEGQDVLAVALVEIVGRDAAKTSLHR